MSSRCRKDSKLRGILKTMGVSDDLFELFAMNYSRAPFNEVIEGFSTYTGSVIRKIRSVNRIRASNLPP